MLEADYPINPRDQQVDLSSYRLPPLLVCAGKVLIWIYEWWVVRETVERGDLGEVGRLGG
jgi:hypothetical protein